MAHFGVRFRQEGARGCHVAENRPVSGLRGGKWGDFGMLPALDVATFVTSPTPTPHTPSMRGHLSTNALSCEASSLQLLACENDLRLELAENL